jgi:hypothetical protein
MLLQQGVKTMAWRAVWRDLGGWQPQISMAVLKIVVASPALDRFDAATSKGLVSDALDMFGLGWQSSAAWDAGGIGDGGRANGVHLQFQGRHDVDLQQGQKHVPQSRRQAVEV